MDVCSQDVPVRLAALPPIPSAEPLFSVHRTGGTICWRAGWSSSSLLGSCLLPPVLVLDWVRVEVGERGSVKGEWVSQREIERGGEREPAANTSLPATAHQASQALETAPNQQLPPAWCQSLNSQSLQSRPAGTTERRLNQSHWLNGALH